MIKHNAASNELNSPHFLANEKTCQQWEKFAIDNGGTIDGSYNSWSYKVFLKIDNPNPWRIIVSRATYSSGNLLFSSKYQNLQDQIVVKTKVESEAEFIIKKSSFKDIFSGKKMSRLEINSAYTIVGSKKNAPFDKVIGTLSKQFKHGKVFKVELKKSLLTITINDENEDVDLVQVLMNSTI